MGETGFMRKSLFMIGGLLVWAAQFGAIYVFNALVCAREVAGMQILGMGIVPFAVVGMTALALLATALIFMAALLQWGPARASRTANPADEFIRYTTMAIALLSAVAIIWNGIPALLVPPCG